MKTKKMKPRNKRLSSGLQKPAKRSIHVKGKWEAVELDPTLFSEEGLEGLVCFEELKDYRLIDSEKAAAKAANELKREKKKTKKRKASEGEEAGEKVDIESKEGAQTAEPAKKKAKNKKKNNKPTAKESDQPDNTSVEVTQKDVVAAEEAGGNKTPKEDASKDTAIISEPDAQSKPTKKSKKKKKKIKQQIKKDEIPETQPNQESPSELQALEKEKSTQDKLIKAPQNKKLMKNWTNAAHSGSYDKNADVSAWKDLFVPSPVLKALSSLGFSSPSPIQALALPPAIRDRMDVLGAAETGSGKTLAFGIPMIHAILEWKNGSEKPVDDNTELTTKVESLYLPAVDESTREDKEDTMEAEGDEGESITEQDQGDTDEHDSNDEHDDVEEKDEDERLGCVHVIKNAEFDFDPAAEEEPAGGRSQPLLGLVLTPTRELAVQVKHHIDAVAKFTDIKTAILVGGMAQQKQRRMLNRRPEIVIATPGRLWDLIQERHPHLLNLRQLRCLVIDEADRMVERGHFAELESLLEMLNTVHFNPKRQTFVFSATLTMDHSLPTRLLQKKKKNLDQRNKLDVLMEKVGIKSKPKIIDLTRKEATVQTLTETRIHCQKEEKDFYLYYFLLQFPGRTMVFANSIDCIKRLNSLLVILDCTPLPLHANMHQKQRLKNLERFAERDSCVLLTTDVAARGLDIPNVEHVIHYQVPRTSETYVHRSGRTARATKEGLSLLIIGPDDMMNFKKIYKSLGKDEELPMFPIEIKCMEAIKERVNLARRIEKIEFHNGREKQHNSWFRQAAEALEVDLDDDLLIGRAGDEEGDREQQKMVKGMKKHLKHLISQPVFKNLIKTRYPTQMGKLSLPHMPLAGRESALTKVSIQEKKRKSPQQKKQKKEQQQQQ
ncbi:ATP-dependent RNA helicase DDX24 [Sander lucioperca]|uniref:ATP-dependent RNA helicase n=1 Tax=Sander lucioperca TaxID=283035 RepID=A0A8C9YU87_SANLU|nr:ATP-dependent RNA helicase DDX24 [Sander lucioperca]XP_031134944.1 ATP-dependent RNA helicase DDX24 [Sander lucioperca]XP_035850492.1 ATP-dependent RNA helicase DDX24 [Sander lucioperca]